MGEAIWSVRAPMVLPAFAASSAFFTWLPSALYTQEERMMR